MPMSICLVIGLFSMPVVVSTTIMPSSVPLGWEPGNQASSEETLGGGQFPGQGYPGTGPWDMNLVASNSTSPTPDASSQRVKVIIYFFLGFIAVLFLSGVILCAILQTRRRLKARRRHKSTNCSCSTGLSPPSYPGSLYPASSYPASSYAILSYPASPTLDYSPLSPSTEFLEKLPHKPASLSTTDSSDSFFQSTPALISPPPAAFLGPSPIAAPPHARTQIHHSVLHHKHSIHFKSVEGRSSGWVPEI